MVAQSSTLVRRQAGKVGVISLALLGVLFFLSLSTGRYPLRIGDVLISSLKYLQGGETMTDSALLVFWHVRLPRTLLVVLAGGGLALSGTVLQGVFRNPLVSPDIIGVSTGASLGAALAIVLGHGNPGTIQLWAFTGGMLGVVLVWNFSRAAGRDTVITLVLAGIIVNSLATAGLSFLKYIADPTQQLPALEFWLLGGFYTADWWKIRQTLPLLLTAALVIISLKWQVNVLSMGDEEAASLGLDVMVFRGVLLVAAAVIVSSVVSVAGVVSWIGLVAPHLARMIIGSNHLRTLPFSFAVGGSIMLLADIMARTVTASEIPVSIITALVGAPFLAYLLWKVGNGYWNRG